MKFVNFCRLELRVRTKKDEEFFQYGRKFGQKCLRERAREQACFHVKEITKETAKSSHSKMIFVRSGRTFIHFKPFAVK